MDTHERIILEAAAAILDAEHTARMEAGDYYAAVSTSHAAYEVRHALRQCDAADRERESEEVTA